MKNKHSHFTDHLAHLLWSLGTFYKHLAMLDFKECREIYFWTLIHLKYKGHKVKSGKWEVSIFLTQLLGFVVSIAIIQLLVIAIL